LIDEELVRKSTQLEQLNKEKIQLFGLAAHDLRNPLAVIQGYSQLLIQKLAGPQEQKTRQVLETINRSSSYMLALINDLLDISVIESGTVSLHLGHFNVVALVDDILQVIGKLATNKNINTSISSNPPQIEIYCDRNKIEQVLTNLLTNAIKFSNAGSTVEVTLSANDTRVFIAVKDQGVGIPEEEKNKLFKPFTKTSAKATAGESSTGLGLAIAKKIVEAHHGEIGVESQLGAGTTFFVTLPKSAASSHDTR
jgi:signal transduction histidine kinase